jgi:hypothetical protein
MKPVRLILPAILLFYALLYMATKPAERCDDTCMRYFGVDTMLRKNRPYIYAGYKCSDSVFCINVKDSVARNWPLLADTACSYIRAVSLPPVLILITSIYSRDTLALQRCP